MNTTLILVGIASAVVTGIFMYIDSLLFDVPRSKLTYFKNMVLVSSISVVIVYFMGGAKSSPPFVGGYPTVAPPTGTVGRIDQEIFTGTPNF